MYVRMYVRMYVCMYVMYVCTLCPLCMYVCMCFNQFLYIILKLFVLIHTSPLSFLIHSEHMCVRTRWGLTKPFKIRSFGDSFLTELLYIRNNCSCSSSNFDKFYCFIKWWVLHSCLCLCPAVMKKPLCRE